MSYLLSIGIMTGTIIGAGIFSLPYIFVQVGILNGILFLFLATAVVSLVHLLYADVILRTSGVHNFVGYSRIYLGSVGEKLAILMSVVQVVLVQVIYLILSQSFFALIFGYSSFAWLILFWVLGSLVIFSSLRRFAVAELFVIGAAIIIIALFFWIAFPNLSAVSFGGISLSLGGFMTAIGPILFALSGRAAIAETVQFARRGVSKDGQIIKIKRGVVGGTVVSGIVYLFFVLAIVALSGLVSADAVSGLVSHVPRLLLVFMGLVGLFNVWTSYVASGFDVNNILKVDLRWPKSLRFLLVVAAPLTFYLLGFNDFIGLVSFGGGVFGALVLIFITLMWRRAHFIAKIKQPILVRVPDVIVILIILVFGYVLLQQTFSYLLLLS